MDRKLPLTVAGVIFLIMAVVHLARYFIKFGLIVAGYEVSLTQSLVAAIILLILSAWMFIAR